MEDKLRSINFIPFEDFLLLLGLSLPEGIKAPAFISYKIMPKLFKIENNIGISDLVKICIKYCLKNNITNAITNGYNKNTPFLQVDRPNDAISLILELTDLLKIIGDDLFQEILINCSLFMEIGSKENKNLLLISGNLNSEKINYCINRSKLFYKNKKEVNAFPKEILEKCTYRNLINEEVFFKAEKKYKKLEIGKLFYKYMIEEKNDINPVKLIDFLFCISKKTFNTLFDKYNFRILKSKLTLLIYKNKFETFSQEEIIRNFSIKKFRFFKSSLDSKMIISREEYTCMMDFTKKILIFLIDEFFIPLINKLIYSTETCLSKSKVVYYKRHAWYKFSEECAIRHLSDTKKYKEIDYPKNIAYSNNIRVIPKLNDGRVIINLNAKSSANSPNTHYKGIYDILKEETRSTLKNSMLGFEKISKHLYPIINHKNVYLLKLDVVKCFDNIKHKYLEKMIEKLFKNENYVVRSFHELLFNSQEDPVLTQSKVKSSVYFIKKKRHSTVNTEYLDYPEYFKKFSNKIFEDECFSNEHNRFEMIEMVKAALLCNKIVYKNKMYEQTEGIPQGSILSTLMCALYFTHLDRKHLNKQIQDGKIIRYVDDFLVISTNKEDIKRFLNISKKLESTGVSFNPDKMEMNFEFENGDIKLKNSEMIYLGMKIKTINGNTYIRNNLNDKNIKYGVSSSISNIGLQILKKMAKFIDSRSFVLINAKNPKKYQNIYDTLVLYNWKVQILFKRAIFINMKFYQKILNFGVKKMYLACINRKIKISIEMLENMMKNISERYKFK